MAFLTRKRSRYRRHTTSGFGRVRNPYAAHERGPGVASRVFLFLAIGGGVGLVGYLLLFSPAFSILDVIVEGTTPERSAAVRTMSAEYLNRRVAGVIPRRNTLLVAPEKLEQLIERNLIVESVVVDRKGPHVLRIVVTDRSPAVVVVAGGAAHLTDRNGIVLSVLDASAADILARIMVGDYLGATTTLQSSTSSTPSVLHVLPRAPATGTPRHPVLILHDGERSEVRARMANPDVFRALSDTEEVLRAHGAAILGLQIASEQSLEAELRTDEGWTLYILAGANLRNQLANLNTVLTSSLRERSGLQYIDLRYGNRVFYQ